MSYCYIESFDGVAYEDGGMGISDCFSYADLLGDQGEDLFTFTLCPKEPEIRKRQTRITSYQIMGKFHMCKTDTYRIEELRDKFIKFCRFMFYNTGDEFQKIIPGKSYRVRIPSMIEDTKKILTVSDPSRALYM